MRFNFRSSAFATALVLLLTFQAYAQHTVRYKLIELTLGGPVSYGSSRHCPIRSPRTSASSRTVCSLTRTDGGMAC